MSVAVQRAIAHSEYESSTQNCLEQQQRAARLSPSLSSHLCEHVTPHTRETSLTKDSFIYER